jgi:hypothetical protein
MAQGLEKGPGPPQISDFSRKAIQRAVLKAGLTHWLTLYPPALGLPCGLAGALFNSPLLYLLALSAFVLAAGNAIVNIFFRHDRIAGHYIEEMNRALKAHQQTVIESLYQDLQACSSIKGARQYVSQGIEQFRRIQEKYNNVQSLVERKLIKGELTFSRFVGAAEQVYLSGLDNLKQAAAILQSAGSIDPVYIGGRLRQLEKIKHLLETDRKEMETLKRRLKLREEQLDRVNDLLTRNEEAMTQMEETTAAIATMQTDGKFSVTDFETAIRQLHEVAERAQAYNTTQGGSL